MKNKARGGYQFTLYQEEFKTPFDKLFDIFKELIKFRHATMMFTPSSALI